ncbi:MAG TPA: PDZ domain-containing protein [Steroidobacteraceae bacterium]
MKKTRVLFPLILCAATALGVGAVLAPRSALSQGAPPPPSVHADSDDLDAQLEAARRKLEEAAHQVAELSAQMSGPLIEKFTAAMAGEPGRAILGVQLEKTTGAAGARVREVSPGGPAAEAGIRAGDVIVALNGSVLSGAEPARQVVSLMREVKPDSKVNVRVLREGKPRELTVMVRGGPGFFALAHGMPELDFGPSGPMPPPGLMMRGPFMDMELVTLTPQLGHYFGADKGVLVVRSPPSGGMQLEDGDVILAIDGRQPLNGSHATRILASYQPGEKLSLHIMREHKTLDVQATVPARGAGPRPRVQRRVLIQDQHSDDT